MAGTNLPPPLFPLVGTPPLTVGRPIIDPGASPQKMTPGNSEYFDHGPHTRHFHGEAPRRDPNSDALPLPRFPLPPAP